MAVHRIDEAEQAHHLHRWEKILQGNDVVMVANFSHDARGAYRIGFPMEPWKLRLNTKNWSGYSEDFKATTSKLRP